MFPRVSLVVRERIDTAFPGRWIGRDGPVSLPTRSPDLTQLFFFLWGYVKTQVFTDEVENVEELKRRIERVVSTVTPAMLSNTW